MITRNADQRKPVVNPLGNSIISYDTDLSKIAKQAEKTAQDLVREPNDEAIRVRRRIVAWGQREVHVSSDEEAKSSVSDRLAANRAKLASKAVTDPVDKNEAKSRVSDKLAAKRAKLASKAATDPMDKKDAKK